MRRLWVLLLSCIAVSFTVEAAATPVTPATFVKPPFPRLAVDWIADQNYDQPAIQQLLARGSIAIISTWPGWQNGRNTTLNQVIQNIKAQNPNELIFQYIKNNEIDNIQSNGPQAEVWNKLSAMHWFLYPSGTNGAPVPAQYPGATEINNTPFTHKDSNGYNWNTWFANWAYNNMYLPSPLLDGFVTDNVFATPAVEGDWNLSGTATATSNPNAALWAQQGYVQHFATLRQLMPGKFQIGNVAGWGLPNSNLTLYQGMLNGGVLEALIGLSWSVESWGGWRTMMSYVSKTMGALAEPKLLIFSQYGHPSDYQSFRYGFASCLMTDAYFQFNSLNSDGSENNGSNPWFDEYAWQGQLGMATASQPTTAWQNGVYRRDFQSGIVLVNPKGNGARTVTLETDYVRLSSTCPTCQNQAPAVNSGQTVKTLTLQDRDGILLLRVGAPKPPTNVSVR